ncbi:MAG: MFS transporter [Kiloniellales bacterium]|nr:MFS transporter [Kiloniellales bacterium]
MSARRLTLIFCLAEICSMTGFATFAALLPGFVAEWSLSGTQAGWINGIFFAGYVAAVPFLVSLTDRRDPRHVYLAAAAITVVSSLGFALFADGFWPALIFRALAGVGLAGTYMPGLKSLTDHLPAKARGRSLAFYTATFSIGTSLSFLLAGALAARWGWAWAFGLAALGPAIAFLLIWRGVPPAAEEHLPPVEHHVLDFRPVLANARAMAYVLAYTLHNWELFALRSWIVGFLVFAQAQQAGDAFGVGWSATVLAAVLNLLALPASVLGNEVAERFGRRRVVIAVMLLSALTGGLFGFSAAWPFLVVLAIAVLYGLTVPADSAAITTGAVAAARPGQRGQTMAVHSTIGFLGGFAGPLVFGVVLDLGGGDGTLLGWGLAFASSGLAVALGPLALLWLDRPPPRRGEGPEAAR